MYEQYDSYGDQDEDEQLKMPQFLIEIRQKVRQLLAPKEKKPATDEVYAPPLISRRTFLKMAGILTGGFAVLGGGAVLMGLERGRREHEAQENHFGIEVLKKLTKTEPFTQPLSMTTVFGNGKFDEYPATIWYSRGPMGEMLSTEEEYFATKYGVRLFDESQGLSTQFSLPPLQVSLDDIFPYMTQDAHRVIEQDSSQQLKVEKMKIEANPFALNTWLETDDELNTPLQHFLDQAREILREYIHDAVDYLDDHPPNTIAYDRRWLLDQAENLPLAQKFPKLDLEFDLSKHPEPSVSWGLSSWQFSSQYTFFINGRTGEPELRTTLYYLPFELLEHQKKRLSELWHSVVRVADQKLAALFFGIVGEVGGK